MKNDFPEAVTVKSLRTVYSFDYRDQCSPSANKKVPGEAHDFAELIFIRSGRCSILVDGERIALHEGQMTLYPPRAYHVGESRADLSVYILSFDSDSELLSNLYSRAITLSAERITELTDLVISALSLYERIPKTESVRGMRKKETASDYALERLKKQLELFLLAVYCEQRDASEHGTRRGKLLLAQVEGYLHERLGEPLTLDEVARKFHLGKSTLTALFQKERGMGMIAYVNRLRIEEAGRLIHEGTLNFTEIADTLGFSSLHYFSRVFKATTGVSPSEYKKTRK
jgi:AraC-like DNA-binding protein